MATGVLFGLVPSLGASRPDLTGALRVSSAAASSAGSKRVVLMKNHGAIVASQSLEQATIEAVMLEQAARYHLECEAAGGTEIVEAEVRAGRAAYQKYFLPNMWEANLRRLRTSDPDLFEGIS